MRSEVSRENLILLVISLILACLLVLYNIYNEYFLNDSLNIKTVNIEDNVLSVSSEIIKERSNGYNDNSKINYESQNFNELYYPYYQLLNTMEADLYNQLYTNIYSYQDTIEPVIDVNINEARKAIEAIYYDHPEFFWLESTFSFKYLDDGSVTEINLKFNDTLDNIVEAKRLFDKEVDMIIKEASLLKNDYEKERYVHDILIEKVEYDLDALDNQSPYSALVYGRTVCAGYARAFQYIMIRLGIPTYYVTGMFGRESHAWNIVKLGNDYYNVDLTYNDTNNTMKYFNVTDNVLGRTHIRKGLSVYLPSCMATYYSYGSINTIE